MRREVNHRSISLKHTFLLYYTVISDRNQTISPTLTLTFNFWSRAWPEAWPWHLLYAIRDLWPASAKKKPKGFFFDFLRSLVLAQPNISCGIFKFSLLPTKDGQAFVYISLGDMLKFQKNNFNAKPVQIYFVLKRWFKKCWILSGVALYIYK